MTKDEALKLEPVAWIEHHKGGDNLEWENPGGKCTPLYTAPPAQPAPVQEPVARVNDDGFIVETGLDLAPGELLYNAPTKRPWVGLTDEEVREICVNEWGINEWGGYEQCRAIEAKLKEKNT